MGTYQRDNQENMKSFYAVAALIAAGLSAAQEVGVRAPARLTIEDCLCQCDSQVFVDKFNRTNGNCQSPDSTGKRWCYLKDVEELIGTYRKGHRSWNSFTTVRAPNPVSATCRDGKSSQQFQGKVFGYHACGTPELQDYRCQELLYGNNNGGSYRPTSRPTYRPTSRPTYRPTYKPTNSWQWGNNGFRNGAKKNSGIKVGATRTQSSDKEDAVSFVSQ